MRLPAALLTVLVGLSAIVSLATAQSPVCEPQSVISFDQLRASQIIIVGEVHGTNEIPAFVERLACTLLANGTKVAIGFEIPLDEQKSIDAYIRSDGAATDRETCCPRDSGLDNFRTVEAAPRWQI